MHQVGLGGEHLPNDIIYPTKFPLMEERVLKQVVEEEEGGKSKMGEEREDPQKLKRLAADSYDYDNDSRWPDYWNNVLIPPHMASRDDVVSHFKRKFYQRYVVRFFLFFSLQTPSLNFPSRVSIV